MGATLAGAAMLAGCAGTVPVRYRPPTTGAAGPVSSAAAVLAPDLPGVLGGDDPAAAYDAVRRDDSLTVRMPTPILASGVWPEPERASIDEPRYITFPRNPQTMIFFVPPYRYPYSYSYPYPYPSSRSY